jgi:hypothetical protein
MCELVCGWRRVLASVLVCVWRQLHLLLEALHLLLETARALLLEALHLLLETARALLLEALHLLLETARARLRLLRPPGSRRGGSQSTLDGLHHRRIRCERGLRRRGLRRGRLLRRGRRQRGRRRGRLWGWWRRLLPKAHR